MHFPFFLRVKRQIYENTDIIPISRKKDNSFGNTYSSIFGKIDNIEIAHIYLMAGRPDKEDVISCYYRYGK